MPRILANHVAQIVAKSHSEEDAREAARWVLAEAARFDYSGPQLVLEVCNALREIAEAEQESGRKQFIFAAANVVCEAAEELSAGSGVGDSGSTEAAAFTGVARCKR